MQVYKESPALLSSYLKFLRLSGNTHPDDGLVKKIFKKFDHFISSEAELDLAVIHPVLSFFYDRWGSPMIEREQKFNVFFLLLLFDNRGPLFWKYQAGLM
jgi:hypothetical protein